MAKQSGNRPAKIVVIGGSQGAVEALLELVPTIPGDIPAAIFVVVHIPVDASSYLPNLLTRAGALRAAHAVDNEPVRVGEIYIAPPNYHLTVEERTIHVLKGPRENRHRPAIDPLFRTAARAFGPSVIAVLLSGNQDDGSAGLLAVRTRGGVAIVQDPADARAADMPKAALQYAGADFILPVREIGPKLAELINSRDASMEQPKQGEKTSGNNHGEAPGVREHQEDSSSEQGDGKPSVFACPECHGVLWEKKDEELTRYRCRVGHAYTADTLKVELGESAERALWAAMRALEEKAAMSRRLVGNVKGPRTYVDRLKDQAEADAGNAEVIRKIIFAEE